MIDNVEKIELMKELEKYNEIRNYLKKISNLLIENSNQINIVNNSISRNCSTVEPLVKFKQEFINSNDNVQSIIIKVENKIKNINIDMERKV